MLGEDKAKVKTREITAKWGPDPGLLNLEDANGSEIGYVSKVDIRHILQAGIAQPPEDGQSHGKNVERWLGSVNANGAQWRA